MYTSVYDQNYRVYNYNIFVELNPINIHNTIEIQIIKQYL